MSVDSLHIHPIDLLSVFLCVLLSVLLSVASDVLCLSGELYLKASDKEPGWFYQVERVARKVMVFESLLGSKKANNKARLNQASRERAANSFLTWPQDVKRKKKETLPLLIMFSQDSREF